METMKTECSSDQNKQKLGAPTSNPQEGIDAGVTTQLSPTSKPESIETTIKDPSSDMHKGCHSSGEIMVVTVESDISGKPEFMKGRTCTHSKSSEDSHECGNIRAPITVPEVGLVTPVLTKGSRSTQLTSTQCVPTVTPCNHNLQGNVPLKRMSMQQQIPSAVTAKSAICSILRLDPEFNLQSLEKLIIHLVLYTKPLQFGVAVKYLSQPIWEVSQDEENDYDKVVESEFWGQKVSDFLQSEEECSIASPSTFNLKPQSLLAGLLSSEKELDLTARFSVSTATTKNLSNQRMSLCALPPSNSSTKSHFPQPQKLHLEEFMLLDHFKPLQSGSGLVSKTQTPAHREHSFESLDCPRAAIHFKHSYCALSLHNTQVTLMMQGNHEKWIFSCVLIMHTSSHGSHSHNPWVSVGQSYNSHTFEYLIVLKIPTKDQITLSITIHPHNAGTLHSVEVTTAHPISELLLYNSVAIPSYTYRYNLALEVFPPFLLIFDSRTICMLLLLMGMIEHSDVTSLHDLPFCLLHLWYSAAGARVINVTSSVAHSPSQNCTDLSMASFTRNVVSIVNKKTRLSSLEGGSILNKESFQNILPKYVSEECLHVKHKPTVLQLCKSQHPPLMRSHFEKCLPLDLRTRARIVSSPHPHEEKDSQKNGNDQGQESSGNDGSSSSRGNRGGGNNSNPPSNSGSGGRDDDNDKKRNMNRDGKKGDSNQWQEKKEATEGEDDIPSACEEDDWQSKQQAGRQGSFLSNNTCPSSEVNSGNQNESRQEYMHTDDESDKHTPRCKTKDKGRYNSPASAHSSSPSLTNKENLCLTPGIRQHCVSANVYTVKDEVQVLAHTTRSKQSTEASKCPTNLTEDSFRVSNKEKAPVTFQNQESMRVCSPSLVDSGMPEPQLSCSSRDEETTTNQEASLMSKNESKLKFQEVKQVPGETPTKAVAAEALTQGYNTGRCQDDPNLVTPSDDDKPVTDFQAASPEEKMNIKKRSPIQESLDGHSKVMEPLKEEEITGKTNTGAAAMEPLHLSSQCHGTELHEDGHSLAIPCIPPNSEKSVDNSVPKKNSHIAEQVLNKQHSQSHGMGHQEDPSPVFPPNSDEPVDDHTPDDLQPKAKMPTSEHSPMLEGGSHGGCSERIRPSKLTQAFQHDPNINDKPKHHSRTDHDNPTSILPPISRPVNDLQTSLPRERRHSTEHSSTLEEKRHSKVILHLAQTSVFPPTRNKPISDPQTTVPDEKRHISEQCPIVEKEGQDEHSEIILPLAEDQGMVKTTTGAVGTESSSSSSQSQGPRQHQDGHSSDMPPSSEECAGDCVPKEKRHITQYSPVLQEGSQNECSEATSLPSRTKLHGCQGNDKPSPHSRSKTLHATVTESQALESTTTDVAAAESPSQSDGMGQHQIPSISHNSCNVKRRISEQSAILKESRSECSEAQTVDQLGSSKVAQSEDNGEVNTDVVMNTKIKPTTCPFPTTVQEMQDGLQAPEKAFRGDYEESLPGGGANVHVQSQMMGIIPGGGPPSASALTTSLEENPVMPRLRHDLLQSGIRPVYGCQTLCESVAECTGHSELILPWPKP